MANELRGAVYVDGFNLYHAIDDLEEPYLKWLNLWRLAEVIARGHARKIEKVVFCTAFFPGDHAKKIRHQRYLDALECVGVEHIKGHATKEPMDCKGCGRQWDQPREKETDINVALALYDDAYQDVYDVAFLISADTDQAATLNFFRSRFPDKKIISVVPPGRRKSQHLDDLAHNTIILKKDRIDDSLFPGLVAQEGKRSVIRPTEYDPPIGWVHPDDRPKKSKT